MNGCRFQIRQDFRALAVQAVGEHCGIGQNFGMSDSEAEAIIRSDKFPKMKESTS